MLVSQNRQCWVGPQPQRFSWVTQDCSLKKIIPTASFRANYPFNSRYFGSLSNDGEVRVGMFEIQLSAVSDRPKST